MSLDFLTQVEFAEPTETRVQRGLAKPSAVSSPGSMSLGAINKVTQTRIRWAMAELTAMNLEKVSAWLDALASEHPRAALEIMLELVKFSTPQQKSMTVESTTGEGVNFGNLTMKQLQGMVFQTPNDDVVSEQ